MKALLHKCFFLFLISLCLLLAACAQRSLKLEDAVADSAVDALQTRVAAYSEWDAQVRIALRHNKLSWRGIMQWLQRENSFSMVFSDLFGRRLMFIESRKDGSVSVIDAAGQRRQVANSATLIESVLGSDVPLDNLNYWLLGAPAPDKTYRHAKFNTQGQLQSYEQSDWLISYTDYYQDGCLEGLPNKLNLKKATTQLWLHIRSWRPHQNTIKTSTC